MDSHMPAVRRSASLASLRSEAYRAVRNTVPSARSLTGARMLGQIMDLLLYRNGNLADSRLFLKLALAFLFSLLLMPSVDFLTNIVIFRKGLRYE